jgi:uncharacterized protein involved in exopolysaccharide biosynthesis
MNTLLTIVGIIVGIVAVALFIAAIAPKDYSVQRSITINKPQQEV